MDEQIHKPHVSRRMALLAALLISPAAVIADEPSGRSVLTTRLTSGFGAGTSQGLIRHVPARHAPSATTIVRPAARVIESIDSPISSRESHPRVLKRPQPTVIEARQIRAGSATVHKVTSLAELIRKSDRADDNALNSTKPGVNTIGIPDDLGNDSIQFEMAPTVRRIALGTYDPDRRAEFGSDAVVRFAEPVDAKLFPKPKSIPIEVPRNPAASVPLMNAAAVPVHSPSEEPVGGHQTAPKTISRRGGPASPVLTPALADPELSELIESSPEPTLDSASSETSQWNSFSYERSRRMADAGGFDLLPLDRVGSE